MIYNLKSFRGETGNLIDLQSALLDNGLYSPWRELKVGFSLRSIVSNKYLSLYIKEVVHV